MAYVELHSGTENAYVLETQHPNNWPEAKRIGSKEGKKRLAEKAFVELHKLLKPGDKVYGIVRHVSSSGMSRRIDLFVIKDNEPCYLSSYAAKLLDMKLHKSGGIVIGGCGMDMIFALVYELGTKLWPNGTPEPHGVRNGQPDNNGGYALKHAQL